MANFNERLKEAMLIRNTSAAELARLTGISEAMISIYKKGKYKAQQDNLEKIANALNVPIPWLMGLDETSPSELNKILRQLSDSELEEMRNYAFYIISRRKGEKG